MKNQPTWIDFFIFYNNKIFNNRLLSFIIESMFYLIDKPKGISSFRAIKDFAKKNSIKKIGHTGTLDPLASGLLLLATNEDTKLIQYVDSGFKTYKVNLKLGLISSTYDSEGEITFVSEQILEENHVKEVILSFQKTYLQQPPIFSAKKIDGRPAYALARQNQEVILKPFKVSIKKIWDIKKISQSEYSFFANVSRGTYIRSIVHEIGQQLNVGAIMTDLRRTEIGVLTEKEIDNSIDILKIFDLPTIEINNLKDLFHGKTIKADKKDGTYGILFKKDIIGIVVVKDFAIRPVKLFGNKYENNKIS